MSGPQPTLSLDEFRRQSRTLQTNRTKAREEYEAHTQEEAQAEHDYRVKRATEFARCVSLGMTAAQAGIQADAEAAPLKLKRDLAKSKAKGSLLRVEELEADRATLRSIAEWSQRIEGVTA
jgi:hypothetical protein